MLRPLFENDKFYAFHKESGMRMHEDDTGGSDNTFLELLKTNYTKQDSIQQPYPLQKKEINLCGLINRLDRDTSGIILVAKDASYIEEIRGSLGDGTIQKKYRALVLGNIKEKMTITLKLGRQKKGFRRAQESDPNSRGPFVDAETEIIPLFYNQKLKISEVLLIPKTGRTHQLRAHLSFIEHPILGDILYGSKNDGTKRLYLHASELVLPDGIVISDEVPWLFSKESESLS